MISMSEPDSLGGGGYGNSGRLRRSAYTFKERNRLKGEQPTKAEEDMYVCMYVCM